jgi:hypothetical protein
MESLLCLPTELSVIIALYLLEIEGPERRCRALATLTSICATLRDVLTQCPSLWTEVRLQDDQEGWANMCVRRAMDLPLRVELHADRRRQQTVLPYLPKAICLSITFPDALGRQAEFWSSLSALHMEQLQQLILCSQRRFSIDMASFSASSLSDLRLSNISITSLPRLPLIRTLSLSSLQVPVSQLRIFFGSTPLLSRIHLSKIDIAPVDYTVPCDGKPIHIHDLCELEVEGDAATVWTILLMLPVPRHALTLRARCLEWSSTSGPNAQILALIEDFRKSASIPPLLPMVHISPIVHGLGSYNSVRLSHHTSDRTRPTLSYTCSCAIVRDDPFLSTVKDVCFDLTWGVVNPDLSTLDFLPGADKLTIRQSNSNSEKAVIESERMCACALEAWIRRRHQQGQLFQSIELHGFHNENRVAFGGCIVDRITESILWVPTGIPSGLQAEVC